MCLAVTIISAFDIIVKMFVCWEQKLRKKKHAEDDEENFMILVTEKCLRVCVYSGCLFKDKTDGVLRVIVKLELDIRQNKIECGIENG